MKVEDANVVRKRKEIVVYCDWRKYKVYKWVWWKLYTSSQVQFSGQSGYMRGSYLRMFACQTGSVHSNV